MQPTTLKLPDELKKRVASLAENAGKSVHAVLIEAVENYARLQENRRQFIAEALEAEAEMERTGEYYDGAEVHAWLRAKLAGKKGKRPRLRKWRK